MGERVWCVRRGDEDEEESKSVMKMCGEIWGITKDDDYNKYKTNNNNNNDRGRRRKYEKDERTENFDGKGNNNKNK